MKNDTLNGFEFEPLIETNVFVFTEAKPGEPSSGSVEILAKGLETKFNQVTTIDTSTPESWANLLAFNRDAVSHFLTYPEELVVAKPLVTVAFLNWNTTLEFIENLIVYGQQTNPLVEDLLICDLSSLLHSQHGKDIQKRFAKAGLLQDCFDILDSAGSFSGLANMISSKSLRQQRMRMQTYEPILRRLNRAEANGKKSVGAK